MIIQGDVLDVLQQAPDEHYSAVLCDPQVMLGALVLFIKNTLAPFENIRAMVRAGFVSATCNRIPAYNTGRRRIKLCGGSWHCCFAMERWIKNIIGKFCPKMFGAAGVALAAERNQVGGMISGFQSEPKALGDQMVDAQPVFRPAIDTISVSFDDAGGYVPPFPTLIRPVTAIPCRVIASAKSFFVMNGHAFFGAINRRWRFLGDKSGEFFPALSACKRGGTAFVFDTSGTLKQNGLSRSAAFHGTKLPFGSARKFIPAMGT